MLAAKPCNYDNNAKIIMPYATFYGTVVGVMAVGPFKAGFSNFLKWGPT